METIKIIFNDGSEHNYNKGEIFYKISRDYVDYKNVLAVKISNEVYPLTKKADEDTSVEFLGVTDLIGNKMYKAGLKFIFQVALGELFPNLDVAFEHSVPRGMLGVVQGDYILSREDISKIKGEMSKIVSDDIVFEKLNVHRKEALKFYRKSNESEKADNVQNINDKVVTLYKLKNRMNYFYTEMPYSTGYINKYDLVYLGNNRIVFLFPTTNGDGNVPEYVHYDNILDSFLEGKNFLDKQGMPYITDLNKTIGSGDIKEFIKSNELKFGTKIYEVVKQIQSNKEIKFVMIAGPSSSGKTTTCSRMASYLLAAGYDPIKISVDDYFVERENTPKDEFGKYDYECLLAIDIDLFNSDLTKLLNKETITLPSYNFITGKREQTEKRIKLNDNSIILIEGLHALNDDLTPSIDNKYKYKVYLSPFIPLNVDKYNYISTLDLRLLRRIIRDNRTRGYDVSHTIDVWQSVRRGEEKYIFPFIHQADIIINTALAYEVGVLKVFVEPLLYSVKIDSIYYAEARRLLDFLKQFFPIPGEYVNDDSILREFIGGKYND